MSTHKKISSNNLQEYTNLILAGFKAKFKKSGRLKNHYSVKIAFQCENKLVQILVAKALGAHCMF